MGITGDFLSSLDSSVFSNFFYKEHVLLFIMKLNFVLNKTKVL